MRRVFYWSVIGVAGFGYGQGVIVMWPEWSAWTWWALATAVLPLLIVPTIWDRRESLFPMLTVGGTFHRTFKEFQRDQGRGDIAARLIQIAPDFQRAEAIFESWHYDRQPRAMEMAVDAMVARIRDEGETPQTAMFLNGALSALADSTRQFLPKDPHGVNDTYHFEWAVMCFEGMWKQPDRFPRKDSNAASGR